MYVLFCKRKKTQGMDPYFVRSVEGHIIWGKIQEAYFFKYNDELIDYLVKNEDLSPEFWINWINDIGSIVFYHPLNIPKE